MGAVIIPNNLPVGYRFHPTDEEYVDYYLKNRVRGFIDYPCIIPDVDICGWDPGNYHRSFMVRTDTPIPFACSFGILLLQPWFSETYYLKYMGIWSVIFIINWRKVEGMCWWDVNLTVSGVEMSFYKVQTIVECKFFYFIFYFIKREILVLDNNKIDRWINYSPWW